MPTAEKIPVKGTKYYKAGELFESDLLVSGASISLVRQPSNAYDKNAVAVQLRSNGAMIGCIPKELALKYSRLLDGERITEAVVTTVIKDRDYIDVTIKIIFNDIDEASKLSSLWKSALLLPPVRGIYSITRISSGRLYIGSSRNVRSRLFSHFRELEFGIHSNVLLKEDYKKAGPDDFEATLVEKNIPDYDLFKKEKMVVRKLLSEGKDLYNMTDDGQGVSGTKYKGSRVSISDRRARDIFLEEYDDENYFGSPPIDDGRIVTPPTTSSKLVSFFRNFFR